MVTKKHMLTSLAPKRLHVTGNHMFVRDSRLMIHGHKMVHVISSEQGTETACLSPEQGAKTACLSPRHGYYCLHEP